MNGNYLENKKLLALIILTLLAYVTGFSGYFSTTEPSSRDRMFMRNKGGDVLFEHAWHREMTGDCAACHHEILSIGDRAECNDCHEDMEAEYFTHEELKQIESHQCLTCHLPDEAKEPQNCRVCHTISHDEPGRVDCITCHDDPDYNKDFLGHDELCDIDGHTCAECHITPGTESVYHQQCNDCHRLENKDHFFEPDGGTRCRVCHLK